MMSGNARTLLDQINAFDVTEIKDDPALQAQLLASARALTLSLERPWDKILRMVYMEPTLLLSTKIAIDLNIFETIEQSGDGIMPQDIARMINIEFSFVERLCVILHLGAF